MCWNPPEARNPFQINKPDGLALPAPSPCVRSCRIAKLV